MKGLHRILWAVAVVASLLSARTRMASAQTQQLSAEDSKLLLTWLLTDCSLGESGGLESKLRSRGLVLRAALVDAAEKGPDAQTLANVEREAGKRYEQRSVALNQQQNPITSDAQALEAARKQTREEFIVREKENLSLRFKGQGVAGLALIGATDDLKRIAADKNSPVRENARTALKSGSAKKEK